MTRTANPKLSVRLYGSRKEKKKIDTVRRLKDFDKNNDVLHEAYIAWTSLDEFREEARRNERYTFGNQWGDKIKNPNGCGYITEEEHIKNQGNVPLKNNRIRGIVRSVLGVFSNQQTEPVCVSRDRDKQTKGEMMSSTLQYSYQLNKLWELDRRNLEYFLISGAAFFKTTYSFRNNKKEVWTDIVNYNRVFFDNHMEDPRHWDCHLIGEIHDIGLYDVLQQFSDGSKEKALRLREIYNGCTKERAVSYLKNLSEDNTHKNRSFFVPDDETRCRVIEVWKKESRERYLVHDNLNGDLYKVEIEQEQELKPQDLFEANWKYIPGDIKTAHYEYDGLKFKRARLSVPLIDWNLENYAISIRIAVEEIDEQITTSQTTKTACEFAANFGYDIGFGETVKYGLKFGSSAKTTQTVSFTVSKTNGNDELGEVIVNFYDDILYNKDLTLSYTRGSRSNYDYFGEPAGFNTRYVGGHFRIYIAPKKVR